MLGCKVGIKKFQRGRCSTLNSRLRRPTICLLWPQIISNELLHFELPNNALTMSEAAVVGEGTEVNKGENARMASFVGALAIGEYCPLLPPHTYFSYIFFSN
jgi:hypothetical protein